MRRVQRFFRLCDNLNCWNLIELRECDLRYGYKHHFCDNICYAIWLSEEFKSYKNPSKRQDVRLKQSISARGRSHSQESRQKISQNHADVSGEKNPAWLGGLSFEPYCPKWTKDLRERIRSFFGNECILCGKTRSDNKEELSCHHIEYNKQACCDGKPVQFAALCHSCHMKTNKNRDHWEAILHRIIDEIYDNKSYYTKIEYANLKKE